MDEETKRYLDNLTDKLATKSDLNQIRQEMAKKADLDEIRKEMATKSDLNKAKKDLISYLEYLDTEFQDHRRNSEIHKPATAAF